jgi:putative FmdB family regulatory protein
MPIYSYRCPNCETEVSEFRKIASRDDVPRCVECSPYKTCRNPMERIVCAPYVAADMSPYQSMITGEMITSRSHHRAHLKAHNCIEIGNETKYLKPKEKIDLAPESKKARKQKIIDQVNALK